MAPSTPLRVSSSASANTPTVEPWSRSTVDRFAGHNSLYKKDAAGSTTPRKTPNAKHNTSTPGVDRYALPNERVHTTPSKPNATFASTTDRFALPGSHVVPTAAPGVGTYQPADLQAARVRGADVVLGDLITHVDGEPGVPRVELPSRPGRGCGLSPPPGAS